MRIQHLAVGLLISTLSIAAMADNRVTETTFEDSRRFFVSCLSEYVAGTLYVTVTGHLFETPSGTLHLVDKWSYTLAVTGESTGRTWVSRSANGPGTGTIASNGTVYGFTDAAIMFPVDDGPKWRFNFNYKLRLDADGNVISEWEKEPTGELLRCLGPAD